MPDLKRLKAAVDAAVIKSRTPPEPGVTSWPLTFPQEHLSKEEWRLLLDVGLYIRTHHRAVFKQFLYESTILDVVVDYLQSLKRAPTMPRVIAELKRKAGEQTQWLIEVPVFNLEPPTETVPLGPGAMLVTTDPDLDASRLESHLDDIWAVHRHLGAELTGHPRWIPATRHWPVEVDTRQTASLLLVEEGTDALAISLAETRARYALAMWCLLSPPRRTKSRRPVWPSAGAWAPSPYLKLGEIHKPYQPSRSPGGSRKGASITEYGPYKLTRNASHLQAPFDALRAARRGNHCAMALLSACRSLYVAASVPSTLERTERVMHLWAAREALSDRGRRGQGRADDRWDRLVANLRLRSSLSRRGYERIEVDEALETLHSLRDLATHKADNVLANLDFPERLTVQLNRAVVGADEISLSLIVANLPILYVALRTATASLTRAAIANGWDELAFHRRFT
jgi:hypothetical protein